MPGGSKLGSGWKEITPAHLRCGVGACPAVYETPRGSLVVVGKTLSAHERDGELAGRIASHEEAVEIDPSLIARLIIRT